MIGLGLNINAIIRQRRHISITQSIKQQASSAFFSQLAPMVQQENQHFYQLRQKLLKLYKQYQQHKKLTYHEIAWLHDRFNYFVEFDEQDPLAWQLLLKRIDVMPVSLILANAYLQSDAGKLKNIQHTFNLMQIKCYQPGCGMPIYHSQENQWHPFVGLRQFLSLDDAITRYMIFVNSKAKYKSFRVLRAQLRHQHKPLTAKALLASLHNDQPQDILHIINQYHLQQYDQ